MVTLTLEETKDLYRHAYNSKRLNNDLDQWIQLRKDLEAVLNARTVSQAAREVAHWFVDEDKDDRAAFVFRIRSHYREMQR